MKFFDKITKKKKFIEITFNESLYDLFSKKQYYSISKSILEGNLKHYKHYLFVGNYFYIHYQRNLRKANSNIISVKMLLEQCVSLPRYEDITNGQVTKSIINPFERNLTYFCSLIGYTWSYEKSLNVNNVYYTFYSNKIIFQKLEN